MGSAGRPGGVSRPGWDDGEAWRAGDSAGVALVLWAAGLWWMALSLVSGLLAIYTYATRAGAADAGDGPNEP